MDEGFVSQILSYAYSLLQRPAGQAIYLPRHVAENIDFYDDVTYLVIYAVLWNVLIEISLIIVFNFKQNPTYIANHLFINICVVVSQLINSLLLFRRKNTDTDSFYGAMELVLLLLEVIQIVLGNKLNHMLLKGQIIKRIPKVKFLHRNLGKLIFVIRKVHMSFYAYYFFETQTNVSPMLIITLVISLTFVIHGFLFILLHRGNFKDKKVVWNYLVYTANNKAAYLDLLAQIERNDFDSSLSDSISLNFDDSTLESPLLKQDIKWVMIENRVFEINNLRHPAGNYILNAIDGKDVTREIYGLKSYRFENKEKGKALRLIHRHVPRTFGMLLNYCIGEIKLTELIIHGNPKDREILKEDSELSLPLDNMDQKFRHSNIERKKLQYFWTIDNAYELNDNLKIIFCFKLEKNAVINLSTYWLDLFGKYFLIKRENASRDFMYAVLSLSPSYLGIKINWYKQLDKQILDGLKRIATNDINDLISVETLLTKSMNPKQKLMIQSVMDVFTCFLPLVHCKKRNKHSERILEGEHFGVVGPLGTGLGFSASCMSKVLYVVKDEGILPLVDFLEFLSQRALIELAGTDIEHPIFKPEYLIAFANDTEFYLYWEISPSFMKVAESLSICALKTIDFVYSRSALVHKLLRYCLIVNDTYKYCSNFISSQFEIEVTLDRVVNRIDQNKEHKFNKYIVSGDDNFQERMLQGSRLDTSAILIL